MYVSLHHSEYFLTITSIDLEDDPAQTKLTQRHYHPKIQPKGVCPSMGAQVNHPGLHCNGRCCCECFSFYYLFCFIIFINSIPLEAQFIISPDHLFAKNGATSKINYGDCFKQYKKFIIKNIDSPQMKLLIGQLNTQIFLTHQQDQQTSTTDEQEGGDEDDFSHAFQEQVTISLSNIY